MGDCIVRTCTDLDPTVEAGAYACDRCLNDLVEKLEEIEDYLRIVTPHRLHRPTERSRPGYHSASPAADATLAVLDPRATINGGLYDTEPDEPADGTAPVIGVITSWAEYILELRPDLEPPRTLADAVRLMRGHATWMARATDRNGHPWIDDAAEELATVHRQLQDAAGDRPPKPIAVCIDLNRGHPCEGPVYWSEKPRDEAQCARCRRLYAGLDLARLRAAQEAS